MGLRDFLQDLVWPAPEQPEAKSVNYGPGTLGWTEVLMGRTGSKSGQSISVQTALECSAWLCGTRVIAEGLAQADCKVIQETPNGARRIATDHPAYRLLYRKPNDLQTAFEFREQIAFHLVLCGNAFVVKTYDSLGRLQELLPYEPGAVTVTRNRDMTLSYRVTLIGGTVQEIPAANMWHLRGPSWNGWQGLNGVHLARNALGLALAAEEFGSELFANGARPSGILHTEAGERLNDEQLKQIRDAWQAAHVGSGQRMRTAVLNGVKWQPLSQSADEAQFIELRKQQVVEVARLLRVNPIMLMHQEGTASYASVEQMFLAHATHTLGPWFERFEQSAEVALLTEREWEQGYRIEIYADELVRGTAKEMAETLQIQAQNGVITRNEWRDKIGLGRLSDPEMDVPRPAANLYGPDEPAPPSEE